MNISKLVSELADDPLGIGYQDVNPSGDLLMNTIDVVTSLNDPVRTKTVEVTSAELLAWAGGGAVDSSGILSRYERIETAATSHASPAIRGACKASVKLIERDGTRLDLNLPDRAAMIGGMVAGGVLTSDEQSELVTMSTQYISRGTEIGVGVVKPGHVEVARMVVPNNPVPSGVE